MNLYLLLNKKYPGYDTYDSAVVRAANEKAARLIHPNKYYRYDSGGRCYYYTSNELSRQTHINDGWVGDDIESLEVILIGKANSEEAGVVCSSFNAG